MSKVKKLAKKSTEKSEEDFYDDDFEDFDYGDDEGNQIGESRLTPTVSQTPSALSLTPETDSVGNNLNTKSSDFADCELMSSLESEYNYEEEEDSAQSQTYDFRLFRDALQDVSMQKQKQFKNGTRSSLTFSNQRVRDIDRDNQILLNKIMKNGPSGDGFHSQVNSASKTQRPIIRSAAEVNRKKIQHKIEYENQLLKRKLDKIAGRRCPLP